MPQIAIFGWLIPVIGFPATLALIGMVSLLGVIVVRHGLNQEKPESPDKEMMASASESDATSPTLEEITPEIEEEYIDIFEAPSDYVEVFEDKFAIRNDKQE